MSSHRVLACIGCQQRKVKCDRTFPCTNCERHNVTCVPATQTKRRRPRFPERILFSRIQLYEYLLRKNRVPFEPLHGQDAASEEPSRSGSAEPRADQQEETSEPASSRPTTNIWNALHSQLDSQDDHPKGGFQEGAIRGAWDYMFANDDHILFGTRKGAVDLSTLHPAPAHLFRLWQTYLDNVDPLLKVTHTPSLQPRVVEVAGDLKRVSPALEALMFGIYSMAVHSLSDSECFTMFASTKDELITKYRFGCEQALLNCNFLRTSDRDCLTALFLYLTSTHTRCHPQSLSSLIGIAVRTAQRMGLHDEAILSRFSVLEAEMRRRLWWALVMLDQRIGELAGLSATALTSAWDCRVPLHVHDLELRAEMKEPPRVAVPCPLGSVTEAVFVVVRSELMNFERHSAFHRIFFSGSMWPPNMDNGDNSNTNDTNNSASTPRQGATSGQAGRVGRGDRLESLDALEQRLEQTYVAACNNLASPLSFLTVWAARYSLSRCRLKQQYAHSVDKAASDAWPEAQRDLSMQCALRMLECDTEMMMSPTVDRHFRWFLNFYFPFFAYVFIVHDLTSRPASPLAERAWVVLSVNYDARAKNFNGVFAKPCPLWRTFSGVILHAWEARLVYEKEKATLSTTGTAATLETENTTASPPMPPIVAKIKQREEEFASEAAAVAAAAAVDTVGDSGLSEMGSTDPMSSDDVGLSYIQMPSGLDGVWGNDYLGPAVETDLASFPDLSCPSSLPAVIRARHMQWASTMWATGQRYGWKGS